MKQARMQKDFVRKLEEVKNLVRMRFPSLDMRQFDEKIGKLGHFHYNRKKFLIMGKDREIYDFLIESGFNPFTVYRWTLLERLPDEIRFMIREGEVSQKKAISEAFKQKHETIEGLTLDIKEAGLRLIRRM